MKQTKRGFTSTDFLVAIIALSILVGIAIILLPGFNRRGGEHQHIKDSTQLRGISQALTQFAASNNGSYPLPDRLDSSNATEADPGANTTKDRTGAIFSVLIFDNALTPEICVSPAELGSFEQFDDYIYDFDTGDEGTLLTGDNAEQAIYDPRFKGTPSDDEDSAYGLDVLDGVTIGQGNFSYAHQRPTPNENNRWFNTFDANEIILSTRTPEISSVDPKTNKHTLGNPSSVTIGMLGSAKTWSGYVAFADNHVEYVTSLADTVRHAPDTPYLDDTAEGDRFLSIFIQSGHSDSDYQPIWD